MTSQAVLRWGNRRGVAWHYIVNRLGNGTPDRRAKGTPLAARVEAPPPWVARSRRRSDDQGGEAFLEAVQARFLKRQLSLPVSTMSQ